MTSRDLDLVTALLIDGNNLLHRTAGSVEEGAQRQLLAKLRGALPPTLAAVLMLDGHAAAGTSRTERIQRGLEVRHAGSLSADDAILRLIADVPFNERAGITVVTDDRALTERARHAGAHTQRLAWLSAILDEPVRGAGAIGGGAIGSSRRARSTAPAQQQAPTDDAQAPSWTPGRGATKKRGNPRRRAR
jgi:hypothetical protein